MNAIAQRITATPAANPAEMAALIAREVPTLAALNQEQLEQIARMVITQRLARELDTAATLAGVDYEREKAVFLENTGRTNSPHTRTAYRYALARLDAWAARQGTATLAITPAQADDFIYSLKSADRAAASIRLDIAAVSSFFTFMERRHAAVKNPFRGTKARPERQAKKTPEIPKAGEVEALIAALPPMEAAATAVMAYRGLRAGALPTLSIAGTAYRGRSKGKDITGELPAAAMKAIEAAALPLRSPFSVPEGYKAENWTNTLEKRIAAGAKKLHQAGKLKAAYSCHDLRHFYAVSEYKKDKDIHRVSRLLDHSSIQVTETYLQSLNVKL